MKKNKKTVLIIVSIVLLLLFILTLPCVKVLSICNRKNPSERVYSIDAYNKGFCISYTHSVNKGRVHDYYICTKSGNLIMTETHFVSYGAGIPEPEETEGAVFKVLDNGYIITDINRQVPRLLMAVGVIANHTFATCRFEAETIGEPLNEIPFKAYFKPQTSLILEVKRVSLIEYITHKLKPSEMTE